MAQVRSPATTNSSSSVLEGGGGGGSGGKSLLSTNNNPEEPNSVPLLNNSALASAFNDGRGDVELASIDAATGGKIDAENDVNLDEVAESDSDDESASRYYYDDEPLFETVADAEPATVAPAAPSCSAASGSALSSRQDDPEYFSYECLSSSDVERMLNDAVLKLSAAIPVTRQLAKLLLLGHSWDANGLAAAYRKDAHRLLVDSCIKAPAPVVCRTSVLSSCSVCCRTALQAAEFRGLACGHRFCHACWLRHVETQLARGQSTAVECMDSQCRLLCPEDFTLKLLDGRPDLVLKYEEFVFQDMVKGDNMKFALELTHSHRMRSHPELRFCPGAGCSAIIRAAERLAKRVSCAQCSSSFCFRCGLDYHGPASCETIKRWLTKCADDSETANYISAHTKDCPNCHACIEKNGGCNHMQCAKCKHHFCWMCFQDWKSHGSEYYECSRYKENPQIAQDAMHLKARKALEKYLHYYERWENHANSLKLEEELRRRIEQRIEEKVSRREGTWIDWQYLPQAAALLTKCRYTLQYTYPYAYYLEPGPQKELFEYQQAQLEKEIEELSWKVERAETTDRGDLESQMNVAEKKRLTLLKDFFSPPPADTPR